MNSNVIMIKLSKIQKWYFYQILQINFIILTATNKRLKYVISLSNLISQNKKTVKRHNTINRHCVSQNENQFMSSLIL